MVNNGTKEEEIVTEPPTYSFCQVDGGFIE